MDILVKERLGKTLKSNKYMQSKHIWNTHILCDNNNNEGVGNETEGGEIEP